MSIDSELSPRWRLVAAHRMRLLRMARRRTVSEHDAEDVVAEAMLRAVERPDVDEDRLPAWLTVVTVRLCIDIARERTRERRRWARADVAVVAGSCEQGVCDRAEAVWVAERVAALPGRQARALRLRASGMDVAGIAQALGVTYRTAESLLARGRAAVRATLSATLGAALLAGCRWLRSTVSTVGGGVAATAALSVAVVTVMLGPSSPDAAAPAHTAPEATDEATAPPHPGGTAAVPPLVPPPVPPTATDSAPAEVSPRRDVPPAATLTVPVQLPAQLPAVPIVSSPVTPPRPPVSVPAELAVPVSAPSLPPAVSTNLIPNAR